MKTMLVVDDDELSRDLLRLLLLRGGYQVTAACSGDDAVSQLGNGLQAEVVLTDLKMPGLAGDALLTELRRRAPAALILAMSASAPYAGSTKQFDGFLLKPFTMEALAAAIAQAPSSMTQAVEPSETPTLHAETFAKLSAAMKPEKLEQLYALCLNDVASRVERMKEYAQSNDDSSYRREAHAIKGGCGLVGAMELQSIAAIEENHGISTNHVATLDEILAAAERLRRMLVAQRKPFE